MPGKDYYMILGVSRSEDMAGIQRAFRDLALRHHPDRAGPESKERFQEISEAYETLSSPDSRASYDSGLGRTVPVTGSRRPGPAPEPLVQEDRPGPAPHPPGPRPEPLISRPVSLPDDFGRVRPSPSALLDHLLQNAVEHLFPKSRPVDPLTVELVMEPLEAERGGRVILEVPVFRACRACGGGGRVWGYPCGRCAETGVESLRRPLRIDLPAGLQDGDLYSVPLRGLGIQNIYLRLLVRVSR
jgi:hypothetical protein